MTTIEMLTLIAARRRAATVDADSAVEQVRVILEQHSRDPAEVLMDLAWALVDAKAQIQHLERQKPRTS